MRIAPFHLVEHTSLPGFVLHRLKAWTPISVVMLLLAPGVMGVPGDRASASQTPRSRPQTPPMTIKSLTGPDTYAAYCTGCHGRTGRGDGPVAGSLRTPMPDLTTLSQRNDGVFPRASVRSAVVNTERPITAHGTGDMPAWGPIFRVLDADDRRVGVRIDNVVNFVETIQVPATAEDGRMLFLTYCASCHGPNGRGDGVMSGELRRVVPDLSKYAMRNGGVFPSVRVRQIIDGTGVAAHGTRDMPVWGDAFRRMRGGSDASATERIALLTKFLESIQDRTGE